MCFYDVMEVSNFEMFEFTTQEESAVKEVLESLAEITCVLLAEGVKTDEVPNIGVMDIICHILENGKKGRGNMLRLAVLDVKEKNGRLKVLANEEFISQKSVEYLEGILMRQLAYFEKNIPKAVELFKSKNFHLLEEGKGIESVQESKTL